jgi:hypothetical protein
MVKDEMAIKKRATRRTGGDRGCCGRDERFIMRHAHHLSVVASPQERQAASLINIKEVRGKWVQ